MTSRPGSAVVECTGCEKRGRRWSSPLAPCRMHGCGEPVKIVLGSARLKPHVCQSCAEVQMGGGKCFCGGRLVRQGVPGEVSGKIGQPPIGKIRRVRMTDAMWEGLRADSVAAGLTISELVRRRLRY